MSIPKVIHYCWFGHGEMPEHNKQCIETWRKYCPDYEIIEWNEDNYDITAIPYMQEAYASKRWGFVPDYARMDIIYNYGGIYLDTDVELIKSLDSLLNYSAFAGIEAETNHVAFGLGFGAEKGCVLLKELCDHYKTLHFLDANGIPDLTPNPLITSEYLHQHKNYVANPNEIYVLDNVTIFPPEYFCPLNYFSTKLSITKNTFSIHHYDASWKTLSEKHEETEYRRFIKLFGEKYGELLFQVYKSLSTQGIVATAKKAIGHLKQRTNR